MGILGAVLAAVVVLSGVCAAAPAAPRETVFLIHGMGRTRASLALLAWRLRREGYRTVNVPYNQAAEGLDDISARLRRTVARESGGRRYHFVAHSLGNVVVRNGFKEGYPPGLGRVVMLAPPNASPRLARKLKGVLPYRWVTGESGRRLADPGFYDGLPVPPVEFGVIAGDKGQRLTFDEPNDGIVTVSETRLAGMKEHVVLRRTHTFLMNAPEVPALCASFLKSGRF